MCELSIDRVRVTHELFVVFGTAVGDDCADIEVRLELRDSLGQALWTSSQSVDWVEPRRWRASFPLTPERRDAICRGRSGIDPPAPSWSVVANCPACVQPVRYSAFVHCCPVLIIEDVDVAEVCEDPDATGVLSRRVTVRWRVERRDAGGAIVSRTVIETPERMLSGVDRTLAAEIAEETFEDGSFLVPTGTPLTLRVAVVGDDATCSDTAIERDIGPVAPCSCAGQPRSDGAFSVADASGNDITESVLAGRCVATARATITAPADARNARVEWLAPAMPDPSDPFVATVAVPDTDEGVSVTARFGSAPCIHERSVTIRRCQVRPDFCATLPFGCQSIAVMWVVVFYFASFACYVGVGLMSAAASTAVSESAISSLTQAIAGLASVVPEPFASKLIAVVAEVATALLATSASFAAVAVATGMGVTLAGLLGYLAWIVLVLLWLACCAPRSQCRYLRSMVWLLSWIGFTMPFWAAFLGLLSLLLQLKFFTLLGMGVSSLFGLLLTSIIAAIFALALKWTGCAFPNPFDPPPFLEDSP